MARDYSALSDHDFELLVADLFGAEDKTVYEVFARGADQGVDLRRITELGPDVVQCKHYRGSTYPQLKSAVTKEALKVEVLDPPPWRYRLVTTQSLTSVRKKEISTLLSKWIQADDQVWGADDLESLLNRHPTVERAHVKLWLSSSAQLDAQLHAATWARSGQLFSEIRSSLPRYVQSSTFTMAHSKLHKERTLVISGPPGIGKTTLARMLLADAVTANYEPIEISMDINEAFQLVNDYDRRIFYYDDFLGSTFLQDRLAKNEDRRLTSFMRRCSESTNNLLVLTTREHILNQAVSWYEELERSGLHIRRLLLTLGSYTMIERAQILYNHIWHSEHIPSGVRKALLADMAYMKIIRHRNFKPRLIEYITGWAFHAIDQYEQTTYMSFALDALDRPDLIWKHAFSNQLDHASRILLLTVATMPRESTLGDVRIAFQAMAEAHDVANEIHAFDEALQVLDDSFTRSQELGDETCISVSDPSIEDFVASWLNSNREVALRSISGAHFFEQLYWLNRQIDIDRTSAKDTGDAFEAAVYRCWNSPNPAWQEYLDVGSDQLYWGKAKLSVADRILFTHGLIVKFGETQELVSWNNKNLLEVAAQWDRRQNEPAETVNLIRSLRSHGVAVPHKVVLSAAESLARCNYEYAWEQLARLLEITPEYFDTSFVSKKRKQCAEWWAGQLEDLSEIRNTDELSAIRGAAVSMGVEVDEDLYDAAHYEIQSRAGDNHEVFEDDSYRPTESARSSSNEWTAITALFANLEDSD